MFNDEQKYQNLLEQIHQLNRQNFLNNHDKIEDMNNKLSNLEKNLINQSNKNNKKQMFILYGITGLNLFLSLILLILIIYLLYNKSINPEKQFKTPDTSIQSDNSILELSKEEILIKENFENIKPIIKKDTPYYCLNENDKTYKIPYTVEIKGKLYKDRFTFILKEDNQEKDCFIKKENL